MVVLLCRYSPTVPAWRYAASPSEPESNSMEAVSRSGTKEVCHQSGITSDAPGRFCALRVCGIWALLEFKEVKRRRLTERVSTKTAHKTTKAMA